MPVPNINIKQRSCQTGLDIIEKIYRKARIDRQGVSEKIFSEGAAFYIVGRQGVCKKYFYVGVPQTKKPNKKNPKKTKKNLEKNLEKKNKKNPLL